MDNKFFNEILSTMTDLFSQSNLNDDTVIEILLKNGDIIKKTFHNGQEVSNNTNSVDEKGEQTTTNKECESDCVDSLNKCKEECSAATTANDDKESETNYIFSFDENDEFGKKCSLHCEDKPQHHLLQAELIPILTKIAKLIYREIDTSIYDKNKEIERLERIIKQKIDKSIYNKNKEIERLENVIKQKEERIRQLESRLNRYDDLTRDFRVFCNDDIKFF